MSESELSERQQRNFEIARTGFEAYAAGDIERVLAAVREWGAAPGF